MQIGLAAEFLAEIAAAAGKKINQNLVAAESWTALRRSDLLFFLPCFLHSDRGKCGKEAGLLLLLELNKAITGVLA